MNVHSIDWPRVAGFLVTLLSAACVAWTLYQLAVAL